MHKQYNVTMSDLYMPDPNTYLESLEETNKKIPKKRFKRKRLILFGIVTMLFVFIGYIFYIGQIVSGSSERAFSVSSLATDGAGHTNILILGIGNPGHAGEKLSDTILVISIDKTSHHAVYISIPRDLRVRPDGYGAVKINQANALGGSYLARKTVENVLGISIQYTLTTDFDGLKDLVDAVGGIDVNVMQALYDSEYPCSDDENRSCGLKIEAGSQHMDGTKALQYARCRKGNCGNDFGRAARQQEVIDLVRHKIEQPIIVFHPIEIRNIATAIRKNMSTDMSGLNLAELLHGLNLAKEHTDRFVLSTAPDGFLKSDGYSSDLVPAGGSYSRIQEKVTSLLAQ